MEGFTFTPDPPRAVVDYLRLKEITPSFSWLDVTRQEHAFSFAVAKATQLDVVRTIQSSLVGALQNGVPYDTWAAELEPRLKSLGWWGEADVVDPLTGRTVPARLGSPRRLRTIYWANTRTARAAGQWERIQRTRDVLPYLLYQLGASEQHRPDHESKSGLILRIDNEFWAVWLPPNGWGCNCFVRQISEREARRLGYTGDNAPDIPNEQFINRRTGEVSVVPQGIDPGWNVNPGRTRARNMAEHLASGYETSDYNLARIAVGDLARQPESIAHITAERAVMNFLPVAVMDADMQALTGAARRTVVWSRDSAKDHTARVKQVTDPVEWPKLSSLLGELAYEVFRETLRPNFFTVRATDGDRYFKIVFKVVPATGEIFLLSFFPSSEEKKISAKALSKLTKIK